VILALELQKHLSAGWGSGTGSKVSSESRAAF
jgi:hypothetical protein